MLGYSRGGLVSWAFWMVVGWRGWRGVTGVETLADADDGEFAGGVGTGAGVGHASG